MLRSWKSVWASGHLSTTGTEDHAAYALVHARLQDLPAKGIAMNGARSYDSSKKLRMVQGIAIRLEAIATSNKKLLVADLPTVWRDPVFEAGHSQI